VRTLRLEDFMVVEARPLQTHFQIPITPWLYVFDDKNTLAFSKKINQVQEVIAALRMSTRGAVPNTKGEQYVEVSGQTTG
jgi:hypothetical protein